MLLWIKDAPTAESNTAEEISEFVDKYVTCSKENVDPYLINYQTHMHASSCMKKISRFVDLISLSPECLTPQFYIHSRTKICYQKHIKTIKQYAIFLIRQKTKMVASLSRISS